MKKILSSRLIILLFGVVLALVVAGQAGPDNNNLLLLKAFDKGKFVDTLTTSDVEVYVDDKLLEVKGLTLVKGLKVKKIEGEEISSPLLPRVIILEFRCYEYDQKFGQMVEHLFRRPYSPADTISLVTPVKIYGFFSESLRDYSPEQLINAGSTILKRDIYVTGKTENEIIQEMTRLVTDLPQASSAKDILIQYQQNLESLKNIRKFDDSTLFKAASQFSKVKAQKHYIVICQQEFLPIPNSEVMDSLLSNRSLMFQASDLFQSINSGEAVNLEPVIQELTDSGIVMDFLYFKTNPRPRPEIKVKEYSTDMFDIYSKLAQSTGGLIEATTSPVAQLRKILENTENYYLISYSISPVEQALDQPLKGVKARLKNKDYALTYLRL
jgi:hypothetical protein